MAMTIKQAAMQLAHTLMDDPGYTLHGYANQEYAAKDAAAMAVVTGTGWTVLESDGKYSVHPFERMDDVRTMLEAKMKRERN